MRVVLKSGEMFDVRGIVDFTDSGIIFTDMHRVKHALRNYLIDRIEEL